MDAEKKKQLVLSLNRFLREKYNTEVVFSGSLGLFLSGIDLGRESHDIDVKVIGIDPNILRKDKKNYDFEFPVHFLGYGKISYPEKYHEVDINGEKVLVSTVETIMNYKKSSIKFNETRKIKNEFTERKRQKDIRDLEYIKEKYGIE